MSDQDQTANSTSDTNAPQMVTEPVVPTPPPLPKPDLTSSMNPIPEPPTVVPIDPSSPPPPISPPSAAETFTVSATTPVETPNVPPPQTTKANSGISKTILGVLIALLLTAGIGAGVLLVGQNQDIRQRAQVYPTPTAGTACGGDLTGYTCKPDNYTCDSQVDSDLCQVCGKGACYPAGTVIGQCTVHQLSSTSLHDIAINSLNQNNSDTNVLQASSCGYAEKTGPEQCVLHCTNTTTQTCTFYAEECHNEMTCPPASAPPTPTPPPPPPPPPDCTTPGVILGRIWNGSIAAPVGIRQPTKCPNCSYSGQTQCDNAPALDKQVTVSGTGGATVVTDQCNTEGPYYQRNNLPNESRTVSVTALDEEAVSWSCYSTDENGVPITNVCDSSAGTGVSTGTGNMTNVSHTQVCTVTHIDFFFNLPKSGSCTNVKMYSVTGDVNTAANWTLLTPTQISALQPGDVIYLTVLGTSVNQSISKARIRVNSTSWSAADETTNKKLESDEFYVSYTIPNDGTTTFNFGAEVYGTGTNSWY